MANRNVYDMDKQKVALVLSMGGARGIAHIGVIEELLCHNFEITSIAGSSMGAMVGAMYASGKMEECKEWLYRLSLISCFRLPARRAITGFSSS